MALAPTTETFVPVDLATHELLFIGSRLWQFWQKTKRESANFPGTKAIPRFQLQLQPCQTLSSELTAARLTIPDAVYPGRVDITLTPAAIANDPQAKLATLTMSGSTFVPPELLAAGVQRVIVSTAETILEERCQEDYPPISLAFVNTPATLTRISFGSRDPFVLTVFDGQIRMFETPGKHLYQVAARTSHEHTTLQLNTLGAGTRTTGFTFPTPNPEMLAQPIYDLVSCVHA